MSIEASDEYGRLLMEQANILALLENPPFRWYVGLLEKEIERDARKVVTSLDPRAAGRVDGLTHAAHRLLDKELHRVRARMNVLKLDYPSIA